MRINIEDVSVNISNKNIIKDINFEVNDKDFIGIIGPNGSGKSTFLKCVYRNIRDYKGSIFINDTELKNYPIKESAKLISTVAQLNNVEFDISVLDMVIMGRSPYKKIMESNNEIDEKLALKALEKVKMQEFKNRNFNSLSGGEKQRVILARALCQDTECLILDEPTNHLDIKYQFLIFNILKEMNITVLSAIHDLNIALNYCNKIVALKDGKIIAFGDTKKVLTEKLIYELFEVKSKIIDVDSNKRIVFI